MRAIAASDTRPDGSRSIDISSLKSAGLVCANSCSIAMVSAPAHGAAQHEEREISSQPCAHVYFSILTSMHACWMVPHLSSGPQLRHGHCAWQMHLSAPVVLKQLKVLLLWQRMLLRHQLSHLSATRTC